MKEIIIKFTDGSEYHLREDKAGDSIIGAIAHNVMFKMNRFFNYQFPQPIKEKLKFIVESSNDIIDKENLQKLL